MEGLDNEIITAANDVLAKKIADLRKQLADKESEWDDEALEHNKAMDEVRKQLAEADIRLEQTCNEYERQFAQAAEQLAEADYEIKSQHQASTSYVRLLHDADGKVIMANRTIAQQAAECERLREVAQRLTDTHQDSTGQWDTDALYTLQGLARQALAPSGGGGTHDIECAVTQWSGGSIQAPMPRCSCRASCVCDETSPRNCPEHQNGGGKCKTCDGCGYVPAYGPDGEPAGERCPGCNTTTTPED